MSCLLNVFEGNCRMLQNWVPGVDVWETDQGTDESSIRADVKDGVLEIHVAKPEQTKLRRIEIGGEAETIEGSAPKSE